MGLNRKLNTRNIFYGFPLYAAPFYIKDIGTFEVGVNIFNLALPFIILTQINTLSRKTIFKIFLFTIYLLLCSFNYFNFLKFFNFLLSTIYLFIYTQKASKEPKIYLMHINKAFKLLFGISLFLIALNTLINSEIFYVQDKNVLGLNLPRLKGILLEPSHFGLVIVGLLLSSNLKHNVQGSFKRFIRILSLILTQSYFAYLTLFIKKLKPWFTIIIIILSIILLFINFSNELFFSNSGLVRLYGLFYILTGEMSFSLLGKGIGFGQSYFSELGERLFGISEFSGFAGDFILDLGILGVAFFFYLLFNNKRLRLFNFVIFFLLYSNFGLGVSLFPVLYTTFTLAKKY